MEILSLTLGLVIGIVAGASLTYMLLRRSAMDTEYILQLAESKLAGKKDVIDGTLKDMKNDLNKVENLMKAIEKDRAEKFGKIDMRLENAAIVMKDLAGNTEGLKNALASNTNRGQWGERMAEDVLRLSGLIEGINFIKQKRLEGAASKPDFTFLLPQSLKLNMDVKFPFNNYQLYVEAKTERERDDYKKKFLKDVRDRLKEVQTRDYINPEDHTVDYVLLFVPNEQIFGFINEMDRALIDEAMRGRTILCSPLSLYAILAVVRQSIDNFAIESKSKEMLSLFGSFKLQWEKFKEKMDTVKDRFESVHKGYEELTGERERQLDRHLTKIEDLRVERSIEPAEIEAAFEKVSAKQLTSMTRED